MFIVFIIVILVVLFAGKEARKRELKKVQSLVIFV